MTAALNKSEKTLLEANLQPIQQDHEVFTVSSRREGVIAEWTTLSGEVRRRRDPINILREAEVVRSEAARRISSELDAFLLFFSEDILSKIVQMTNQKLEEQRQKFMESTSQQDWTKNEHRFLPITRTELLAFLGLSVLRGTVPLESASELFSGAFAPPPFKAAMGLQ